MTLKVIEDQELDESSWAYEEDKDHEDNDIMSMSAIAATIKHIGSINIQELEAKI